MKAYSRNQVYKTIMILGGVVFSLGLILSAIFKDYQSTLWFVVVGLGFVSQFGKWKKPYAIIDDGNLVLNSGKKEIHFRLPAITITSRTAKKVEFVYNSEKEQKKHTISLANIHKRQRREFLEDLLSAVDHEG